MVESDPRPLSPRLLLVWHAEAVIAVLVATLLVGFVGRRVAEGDGPAWSYAPAALVLVLGSVAALAGPRLAYDRWRYVITDEALELRHGILTRRRSFVPYYRVQHVDITAGPLERSLGLARLVLHTASAATDAHLPGLAREDAEALRRRILSRVGRGDAV